MYFGFGVVGSIIAILRSIANTNKENPIEIMEDISKLIILENYTKMQICK